MGIGLAKRMPFHVHRLANPGRIAIDVSTAFPRTTRRVTFMDKDAPAGHVRAGHGASVRFRTPTRRRACSTGSSPVPP